MNQALPIGPGIDKAGALRGAHPLVAVAGIEINLERIEIEIQKTRTVGAVDHHHDAVLVRQCDQLLDREHQSCGRGDVADEQHPCGRSDGSAKRLHHLLGVEWQRHFNASIERPALPAAMLPRSLAGAIFMIRCQDFVAWLERNRSAPGY